MGTATISSRIYSPREVRLVLVCLTITLLMFAFNQTLLSTALPTIAGDLGGLDRIAWVISGFVLTSTMSMPVYGSLSDHLGRKTMMVVAIIIFTCGSVAAALAPTMDALIACRLTQGCGGGGLLVLSQTILADAVPARERAKYTGVFGAVWAVASVVGPLLGGWFTDGPGWTCAFWFNVPLGLIALVLTLCCVKRPQIWLRPRLDILGIFLLVVSTTGVVLLAAWAGTHLVWHSPEVVVLIVGTLLSAAGFVVTEQRATHPIMPLRAFRDPTFVLATGSSLLTGGIAMFAVVTYLPVFVQMVKGLDATEAGMILIPMIGSILITSTITGFVVTRTGRYKLIPVLGTSAVAVALALMSGMGSDTSIFELCAYSALMGAGLGTAAQLLVLVVQNALPAEMVGSATAATNYFRQVGAAIGISAVGSVFTSKLAAALTGTPLGEEGMLIDIDTLTPSVLMHLPKSIQTEIANAYSAALPPLFFFMVPLAVLALMMLVALPHKPLTNH